MMLATLSPVGGLSPSEKYACQIGSFPPNTMENRNHHIGSNWDQIDAPNFNPSSNRIQIGMKINI